MPSNIPLKKLLKTSLNRNTNKKLFVSLLEQLLSRESVSDTQLGEILLEFTPAAGRTPESARKSLEKLHREYAFEYAFSKSENLSKFFGLLPQLSEQCQQNYLLYFRGQLPRIANNKLLDDFCEGLAQYTASLNARISASAGKVGSYLKRLWYSIVFLWGALIDIKPDLNSMKKFQDTFLSMNKAARAFEDTHIREYIPSKLCPSAGSGDLPLIQEQPERASNSKPGKHVSLNLSGKKYQNYVSLKKFAWLNYHFVHWRMNTYTTHAFIRFFSLQELSHTELVKELTYSFLTGYHIALKLREQQYVVFNWKNFILTQLPCDLKVLVPNLARVDEEYGLAITAAVALFNDINVASAESGEPFDMSKEFLRACMFHEILSIGKFRNIYPTESEKVSPLFLIQEIESLGETNLLAVDFKSKLENVNTEYTSLEESKVIEYIQSLPSTNLSFLKAKQQKLAGLVAEYISRLIRDKNHEKLSWIALVFLNAPATANYIFYQSASGPWMFLNKIINYIDGESFSVDEDDGNFQDTYACFGITLTGVILVCKLFGIDFSSFTMKASYTISFINEFFFRLCDMLTDTFVGNDESDKQIISSYENLFTEWANALFDANNDGLSDDLLKSVNVQQIYKFLFILFRQAFMARVLGTVSENSLNNGIDYLSQNFLAPCSLEAMQWIVSRIGPQQKHSGIMVDIMLRIIEGNIGDSTSLESNGQKYIFRMILNIIGPDLMRKLKKFGKKPTTENMTKLSNIILQETDAEYCQWSAFDSQGSKGLTMMAESLKNEVLSLLRGNKTLIYDSLGETWQSVSHWWRSMPVTEFCCSFLEEIEHSTCARGTLAIEDSKLLVDFSVFMVVSSSCPDSEDTISYLNNCESLKSLKSLGQEPEAEFKLSMNDHFSSIFNEDVIASVLGSAQDEGKPSTRDQLMGDYQMQDLFEDMPENFFDEPMSMPMGTPQSLDVETAYKQTIRRISPLWLVSQILASPGFESASRLTEVAQAKINDEIQNWRTAHEC